MKHLDRILGGVLVALSVAAFVLLTVIAATDTATPSALSEKSGLTARSAQPVDCDFPRAALPRSRNAPTRPEETPYSVPATVAPELSAFADRDAKDRVPADITSRIPRVRHEEDIAAVVSVLLDTGDDDTVRNEAANLLHRSNYTGLTDDLIKVLENPEEGPRFRSFCIQHLWMNVENAGPAELDRIVSKLREALRDRHIPVRREALLALVRMKDPKGKETAIEWLTAEKAEGLRDAAIRCVRELDLREHVPTIRKYARDPDTVVRIAAIVTLSQWGDEESRPAFEEAASSDNFRLQRAGKLALRRIREAQAPEPSESTPPGQF